MHRLQLMDSAQMERRVAALHGALSLPMLGLLPGSVAPVPGRRRQCAAILDFLLILCGWLLPVYLAARKSLVAAGPRRRRSASQRLAAWLGDHVFLEGGPAEARVYAWLCLVIACWLAGGWTAAISTGCG